MWEIILQDHIQTTARDTLKAKVSSRALDNSSDAYDALLLTNVTTTWFYKYSSNVFLWRMGIVYGSVFRVCLFECRAELHFFVARVNQPPWFHQLAVPSIGWAGWFVSFSFISLPYINQNSMIVNLFWLRTFDHFFFHCQFFPNFDLHTTHPPSYYTDLNVNHAY